jgi:hypothetical protein
MSWGILNSEGKKHWGDIFPDGQVPLKGMVLIPAKLAGIDAVQTIYLVNWRKLTSLQQAAILVKLNKLSGTSKEEILKEILSVGLPLREKYTCGCIVSLAALLF